MSAASNPFERRRGNQGIRIRRDDRRARLFSHGFACPCWDLTTTLTLSCTPSRSGRDSVTTTSRATNGSTERCGTRHSLGKGRASVEYAFIALDPPTHTYDVSVVGPSGTDVALWFTTPGGNRSSSCSAAASPLVHVRSARDAFGVFSYTPRWRPSQPGINSSLAEANNSASHDPRDHSLSGCRDIGIAICFLTIGQGVVGSPRAPRLASPGRAARRGRKDSMTDTGTTRS